MQIGIGIVGGGYMGKAHAVAMRAVGAVFNTTFKPRLEMVCATTLASAEHYRTSYGFARATCDWRALVDDSKVQAIVIASPQDTHCAIVQAALAQKKPVFCEKPLGQTLDESRAMADLAQQTGVVNMVGYNYIRTPASQYARQLIAQGAIGDIVWFRGEHTEDFLADPATAANWRTSGSANGALGDLAPHIVNAALALVGPIEKVMAEVQTVHKIRPASDSANGGEQVAVGNDDQVQMMCRFARGVMGQFYISRVATGRKMGYAYDIYGSKGAIRFDQEDQNALWLYERDADPAKQGFRKILMGPAHPDYLPFCQGPGHGTGYQDQITIEARDFLQAIAQQKSTWPDFAAGHEVNRVLAAVRASAAQQCWVAVAHP